MIQEDWMQTLTRTPPMPFVLPNTRLKSSSPPVVIAAAFALLAAALLWACYFPLNAGALAWFALVPLLVLVRSEISTRQACGLAFLSGMLFYWVVMQWIR